MKIICCCRIVIVADCLILILIIIMIISNELSKITYQSNHGDVNVTLFEKTSLVVHDNFEQCLPSNTRIRPFIQEAN